MSPLKKFALVLFACDNDVQVVNTKSISKIFEGEFTYGKKFKVSRKTSTGGVKQFDCTILLFSGKWMNFNFCKPVGHVKGINALCLSLDDDTFLGERKLDYETNNLGKSKLALLRKEKEQEEEELDGSQDGEDPLEGGSEIDNSESQIIEESDEASNQINKDGSRKSTRLSIKQQKDMKSKEETKVNPTKAKAVSVSEKKKAKSKSILDQIKKDMSSAKVITLHQIVTFY